jgi:type III secretory pathway component EscR
VIVVSAPPAAVRRSFVLWVAAVVVGLVTSAVSLAGGPATVSPAGLVVGVLVLVLLVGCAVALRRGRAWARLALTIVGGVSVLVTVLGLTFGTVSTVAGLVQAALIVAAILSAHQAPANAWFRHE